MESYIHIDPTVWFTPASTRGTYLFIESDSASLFLG
jgi:hypothetical protein